MTATTTHPVPRPPGPRPTPLVVAQMRAARLSEVHDELTHLARRSTQELPTALLEVVDAAVGVRAFCPHGAVSLEPEEQVRADAARLRLDTAVIHAIALGATAADITSVTRGVEL